jgi:hypothetical protein
VTVRFRPGTAQGAGNIAMVAVMSGATPRRVGPISASRLTAWSLCAARPSVRPGRGRRLLDYAALRSGLPGAESRLCTTFEATGPRRGAGVTRGGSSVGEWAGAVWNSASGGPREKNAISKCGLDGCGPDQSVIHINSSRYGMLPSIEIWGKIAGGGRPDLGIGSWLWSGLQGDWTSPARPPTLSPAVLPTAGDNGGVVSASGGPGISSAPTRPWD